MVDMRAFGNLISGANQPGAGYRPGIDPEHAYYNYAPLSASGAAQDATGGASQAMVPRRLREEGAGAGERSQPGFDPNQGAGTSDLSVWEGIKKFGPYALAVAGGPAGMGMLAAKKGIGALRDQYDYRTGGGGGSASAEREETFAGEAMSQYEQDYGGGSSGARDDIGSRDGGDRDRGGHQSESEARGGGDYGEGRYHQGGPVTDQDPSTYRENMEITAQEGEVVMTRAAVQMLGVDFFEQINQAAKQVGQPNQAPVPAPQAPAATGLPAFAQMAGGAPV